MLCAGNHSMHQNVLSCGEQHSPSVFCHVADWETRSAVGALHVSNVNAVFAVSADLLRGVGALAPPQGRGIRTGKLFPVTHAHCGKFASLLD